MGSQNRQKANNLQIYKKINKFRIQHSQTLYKAKKTNNKMIVKTSMIIKIKFNNKKWKKMIKNQKKKINKKNQIIIKSKIVFLAKTKNLKDKTNINNKKRPIKKINKKLTMRFKNYLRRQKILILIKILRTNLLKYRIKKKEKV